MFLNMIIFIKQKIINTCLNDTSCFAVYRWEELNKLTLKIELIIYTMIKLKILMQSS